MTSTQAAKFSAEQIARDKANRAIRDPQDTAARDAQRAFNAKLTKRTADIQQEVTLANVAQYQEAVCKGQIERVDPLARQAHQKRSVWLALATALLLVLPFLFNAQSETVVTSRSPVINTAHSDGHYRNQLCDAALPLTASVYTAGC